MFVIATLSSISIPPAGASPPPTRKTLGTTWSNASSRLRASPGRARPMPLPVWLAQPLAIVSVCRASSACPVQPPRHSPRRPRSPPRSFPRRQLGSTIGVHRAPREEQSRQTTYRSRPIHGLQICPAPGARCAGRTTSCRRTCRMTTPQPRSVARLRPRHR
jgi:hypothetical protein